MGAVSLTAIGVTQNDKKPDLQGFFIFNKEWGKKGASLLSCKFDEVKEWHCTTRWLKTTALKRVPDSLIDVSGEIVVWQKRCFFGGVCAPSVSISHLEIRVNFLLA